MRHLSGLLAALLLAACGTYDGQEIDQVGYVYPPACRRDLSYVDALVVVVPEAALQSLAQTPPGRRTLGVTFHDPAPTLVAFSRALGHVEQEPRAAFVPLILISDKQAGWRYDDTLRHERCHVVEGSWHPDLPGK